MIDLYKLHIFDVVLQMGSFSAAAERIYMTQSAVSQHIKELESSLGQILFIRGRRGVTLTPAGETLSTYSSQIFDLLHQAENALTNVGQLTAGKISLGATPGVGVYLAPDWVQEFRAQYPQITVALQTGVTSQIVTDTLSHRLDIGIIEGELDGSQHVKLAFQVLEEVEQMVVVGFQHPFWDREQLNLSDLDHQSFIMRQQGSQSRSWLEEKLRVHSITPIIGAEFDNLESMKRAVTAGRCLAVLPSYVLTDEVEQHHLRVLPIKDKPLVRRITLIWEAKTPFSPITYAFLNYLADRYPILNALCSR